MKAMIPWFALIAGCAMTPLSESELADRQYKRLDARLEAGEAFSALKQACASTGGTLYVRRRGVSRLPLRASEMKTATCESPVL